MSLTATAPRHWSSTSDTPLQTWIGTDGGEADVRAQLHRHMADMGVLCKQVKLARADCDRCRDPLAPLYDELIETIEQHRDLIAGQLSELDTPVRA